MIKVEVCKCIDPFNKFFETGEYYLVLPTQDGNGHKTAYISPTQGFLIRPERFTYTRISYYQIFFEPVAHGFVKNKKELKALKQKPIQDILVFIKEQKAS